VSYSKVLFISDVHLGIFSPEQEHNREQRLVRFLRDMLKRVDRLFIVGDLFDFWFEYRMVMPKDFLSVLTCLRELTESGVRIDYIAGNHDFWAGDFFRKELGLHFHPEPVRETIDGKQFYIIHGDGLKKMDRNYRLMKRIFRNKVNIFLYRWLHPDIGVPLAKWCSGLSRSYTANRDYGNEEEYIAFAERRFAEGIDYVIMAHTHSPFDHINPAGKRLINLGDWITNYTYAEYADGVITLKKYEGQ
jgi:UDP-2,3-diacylglucosamine hydrolase